MKYKKEMYPKDVSEQDVIEFWISRFIIITEQQISESQDECFKDCGNNYRPMQHVMVVVAQYEKDGFAMHDLYNEGFTPKQASDTILEYYCDNYWNAVYGNNH